MTSPNLLWQDGQPTSTAFDDVYFSADNGLEESRYVFLQHNRLEERWRALCSSSAQAHGVFTIGETGFGTGLNFLAAWALWNRVGLDKNHRLHLHFISVEKYPLSRQDLIRALALWPELQALSQALIDAYPIFLYQGVHRLTFNGVTLTLIIDDAATGFQQMLQPVATDQTATDVAPFGLGTHPNTLGQGVDAWFLDGFAPAKNPSMWREEVFTAIGQLSAPDSTAATFTCARIAKNALHTAGFDIKKAPGFGRKREMLFAQRRPKALLNALDHTVDTPSTHAQRRVGFSPWSQLPALALDFSSATSKHVTVVGAGLAGCHTAYALAQRGWSVTVLDRRDRIADGASGNVQGALFLRLSPQKDTLAEFNLHAFLFAERFYRPLWDDGHRFGKACGLLQLANHEKQAQFQRRIVEAFAQRGDCSGLFQWLTPAQASEKAGIPLEKSGLFFPTSGWLSPSALCDRLLDHPNIAVSVAQHCDTLTHDAHSQRWVLRNKTGERLHETDVVILTGAHEVRHFQQTHHLPLKPVRGQVSHLTPHSVVDPLKTVLTAEGYLTPRCSAHGGLQSLGATFEMGSTDERENADAHAKNARLLSDFGIQHAEPSEIKLNPHCQGRARIRCTTPDYLPIVGPAPIASAFEEQYQDWRKNAKFSIPTSGAYYPNLYVNCGHGSRGLTYTPIAAELLAAMVHGEANPVGQSLSDALAPARFLVRDIKRGKR